MEPVQSRFQVAILGALPDDIDGLGATEAVEWLVCKQTAEYVFEFYKDTSLLSSVNLEEARFDLQNLIGILVADDAEQFEKTAEQFEKTKDKWSHFLPHVGIVFTRIAKTSSEEILSAAVECIAGALKSQRQHGGRSALQLATYRREFERLQHSFSRLEEYIGSHSLQRPTEVFEYPADASAITGGEGGHERGNGSSAAGVLMQYLPVDSLGVSSLAVHIAAKPEGDAEPLRLKISAIETGHIFAEWSLSAETTTVGWVDLALHHAIDEPALSLMIVVEWPPNGSGWLLSLGPPHPYQDFCAQIANGEHLRAPLALRVFTSLPGVRLAPITGVVRPTNSPATVTEFVRSEVYRSVAQLFPPVQENKPLVSPDMDIGCITVHPRVGGATVGCIRVHAPKHAWRLSAQIHLAHEQANPTQFGLLLCAPRDESKELTRLDLLNGPSPTFSGWKTVAPLEKKNISVLLAPGQQNQLSVLLLTRQAPEASPDFAWARFSQFAFTMLPDPRPDKVDGDSGWFGPEKTPAAAGLAIEATIGRHTTE